MSRLLAILAVLLATLPGVGLSGTDRGGQGFRSAETCLTELRPPRTACCEAAAPSDDYCPMSDGPCCCSASPAPVPEHRPEAPLPRKDKDPAPGVLTSAPRLTAADSRLSQAPTLTGSQVLALRETLSHNRARSLLSVWRT